MKIALISDIHGNDAALDSVLEDISRAGVDSVVCLGDVATLGPSPREVLDKVKALNCQCILGNHEEALFSPDESKRYGIEDNVKPAIDWCADKLNSDDLQFLHGFPLTAYVLLTNSRKLYCYHGSPVSTIDGIYPNTPPSHIGKLFGELDDNVVIAAGAHTHEQMLRQHNSLLIINSGSVGCAFVTPPIPNAPPSFMPVAEYCIIEDGKHGISVEFRRVSFDVHRLVNDVTASDLPLKNWWQAQFARLGY